MCKAAGIVGGGGGTKTGLRLRETPEACLLLFVTAPVVFVADSGVEETALAAGIAFTGTEVTTAGADFG